jgi:hypothetical protein
LHQHSQSKKSEEGDTHKHDGAWQPTNLQESPWDGHHASTSYHFGKVQSTTPVQRLLLCAGILLAALQQGLVQGGVRDLHPTNSL